MRKGIFILGHSGANSELVHALTTSKLTERVILVDTQETQKPTHQINELSNNVFLLKASPRYAEPQEIIINKQGHGWYRQFEKNNKRQNLKNK